MPLRLLSDILYIIVYHLVRYRLKVTRIVVAHRLSTIRRADRILVLHRGLAVEEGPAARILSEPRDPYTRELLAAEPRC